MGLLRSNSVPVKDILAGTGPLTPPRTPPRAMTRAIGPGALKSQYPSEPAAYQLEAEIGRGGTATVWKALCVPLKETVAIKSIDLEKCHHGLDTFRREAQIMTMLSHPNLVRALSFFTKEHYLWVVMPYCDAGSCLHIMKSKYPHGLEEAVVVTILRETLKGLDYLHHHGLIHRDVKAGNILLETNGNVKLGDFGVSGQMFDTGDRLESRNTFVGTPCWMAPEVLEGRHGYDFKADMWSFGITALELAHGHAPFEKMTPMKVLMATLQGHAPGLDKEHEKKFSKAFKEMVAMCLVKEPSRRPSAEKLLKHPVFKGARSPDFLVKQLLQHLLPLEERVKDIKAQEVAQLVAHENSMAEQEQISQTEYQMGVSAWNFDVAALKVQAAQIKDDGSVGSSSGDSFRFMIENSSSSGSTSSGGSTSSEQQRVLASLSPRGKNSFKFMVPQPKEQQPQAQGPWNIAFHLPPQSSHEALEEHIAREEERELLGRATSAQPPKTPTSRMSPARAQKISRGRFMVTHGTADGGDSSDDDE